MTIDAKSILFALLRMEICGETVSDDVKKELTPTTFECLYELAVRHSLAHVAGQALGNMGLLGNDDFSKKFKAVTHQIYMSHIRLEKEYNRICKTLENAQIPFIPLKGAVIRKYYPEAWMRNSCDIDILIKEGDLKLAVKVLEEQIGYTKKRTDEHDISMYSSNGVHLELHFALIIDKISKVHGNMLSNIWEKAKLVEGKDYCYEMPDEWFYFYHMAHMAKHFRYCGCGVRLVLDTWVLNHRISFDPEKREQLLKSGGLLKFEIAVNRLAAVWFDGVPENSLSTQMTQYILNSGIYGTAKNQVVLSQAKAGGKAQYIRSRFVIGYDELKCRFPVLKKHKWMLPIFQIIRWLRLLFVVGIGKCMKILRHHGAVSTGEINQTAKLLEQVGLLEIS